MNKILAKTLVLGLCMACLGIYSRQTNANATANEPADSKPGISAAATTSTAVPDNAAALYELTDAVDIKPDTSEGPPLAKKRK